MVRTPFIDRNGIKRGSWSEDEDNKLRTFVERFGHANWRQLPKYAGLMRCGKSCRLRWMNYLRPGLKKGNYSEEEELLIIKLHKQLGNRWSVIAAKLPGRSDNDVKNHWHGHLKKRMTLTNNTNSSTSTSTLEQFTESCEHDDEEAGYDMKELPITPSDSSNKLNGIADLIDEEDNYIRSMEQLSIFTSLELSDSFSWTKMTIDKFQTEPFDNFWSEQLFDNFWTQPFF